MTEPICELRKENSFLLAYRIWLRVRQACTPRIWTNMCWGISASSDCVHTIWKWSLANGMVVLTFVINVSVEKFKMRSMCFSFASVLSDQITDNGCAFGPRKASKVGKPSSRGVSYLHRVVPIASTSSLAHALALSAHMYVCLLLWVYSALRGCHTAGPSWSWDQWIRQASRPHCGYTLIIWLNEQIESETLHGTGSFEDPWYLLEFFTCCQLITKTIKSRR